MKKIILFSIIIAVFLSSCKKDQKNIPKSDQTQYKVNFNVSGFTQQIIGSTGNKQQVNSLQTLSNPIDTAISVLYYIVYDANKKVVSQVREQTGQSNFGTISDNLAVGTYTVVFAGGDSYLTLSPSYISASPPEPSTIPHVAESDNVWGDLFFKKITLTISGGDITQNVNLDRVVGKLTINLEDVLPANADTLVINVSKEYIAFPLLDPLSQPAATSSPTQKFVIPVSAIGTANFRVSTLMINTAEAFIATITCYDSSKNILGQASVSNVTLAANAQTILSGKLFGSTSSVNTGVNYIWGTTPITISF